MTQDFPASSTETAFWRRLDTAGHDGATLTPHGDGWLLRGMAVFDQGGLPACLAYEVHLLADWRTRSANVQGFVGPQPFSHAIERTAAGWRHNGEAVAGLEDAVDIDFGFTPATNMAQLRRVALQAGQEAAFTVAWLDVDAPRLVPLPQWYRRIDQDSYDYDSPSANYRATLRMARSGFASDYPTLWRMVEKSA